VRSLGSFKSFASFALALTLASPPVFADVDASVPPGNDNRPTVILVIGVGGTPTYSERFRETAGHWQKAATRAGAKLTIIGATAAPANSSSKPTSDKAALEAHLRAAQRENGPLWLILVGHGTYDGRTARFNLRGADVSSHELRDWCASLKRSLVVVNGAASSGPFLPALAGPERIVITATKSGNESSAPRFGRLFAEAIADPRADLDRDGGTSVLEAFLYASRRVESSFAEQGLLATEHPLLDDNGDGLGTSPDFFRGLVATARSATDVPRDGARAGQTTLVPTPAERALPPSLRRRRNELEVALLALRDQRGRIPDATYYTRVERLLLQLARVYETGGRRSR
jgi:hypothetical protein